MKDDISVFWRCNKTIFASALIFSIVVCAVLFSLDIPIRALLIVGVALMWFVAVTTSKYRNGVLQTDDTHSPNVELEIWQDIEPTWATDAAVVISVIIFCGTFFCAVYFKYKTIFPVESFG